jgi:hypothetical protein
MGTSTTDRPSHGESKGTPWEGSTGEAAMGCPLDRASIQAGTSHSGRHSGGGGAGEGSMP